MRNNTWTCLSGKPDSLAHSTTSLREMTSSNKLPFTTPFPTLGKDHLGKRMEKE